VPVGVSIADIYDIACDALRYEIPDPAQRTRSGLCDRLPVRGQDRMGTMERRGLMEADVRPVSP
jgi:hypothetical protein